MGRKTTNDRTDLSLHFSDFVRRMVERENGKAANRWMNDNLPGRSGTYWGEHLVKAKNGPPLPLTTADLSLVATAFRVDPYDLVAWITEDKIDKVPRFPSRPKLAVVPPLQDEPDTFTHKEDESTRYRGKVARTKKPEDRK